MSGHEVVIKTSDEMSKLRWLGLKLSIRYLGQYLRPTGPTGSARLLSSSEISTIFEEGSRVRASVSEGTQSLPLSAEWTGREIAEHVFVL
jgi:hypothetical protein